TITVQAALAEVGSGPVAPAASSGTESAAGAPPDLAGDTTPLTTSGATPEEDASEAETTLRAATDDLDAARSGGMWGFLLLAVGAGLAALLTPCVFPMIPLTVSYFTRHAESRSASVRMALVYGASIV